MRNDEIQTDLVEIPTIKGLLNKKGDNTTVATVSYTHLRAHET